MSFFLQYSLVFLLVLLLPYLSTAQSHTNISLGSSLKAINAGTYWSSQFGDFAFGFQQIRDDGYLLAIWFNKIPEKTIVWSANRNNLAAERSKLELTADGRLVLTDPTGREMWSSVNSASYQMAYAAMLDTGNFVLATRDAVNLWQSFDSPTDTLLPTQSLNQGGQLVARYTEMNYSEGRFKFILQTDGNLVLYKTNFPFDTNHFAYWTTQTSIGSGFQVLFNQSGSIYLIAKNGSILNNVFLPIQASTQDYYQRATIDYDGVLRHYVYPKNNDSSSARMEWTVSSFEPPNICLIAEQTGSGACGFNSYCSLDNENKPICKCPPGYTFLDENDVRKGCRMNFASQTCDESQQERDDFEFVELINTNWPFYDYAYFGSVSEDWCKEACLSVCYCALAIYSFYFSRSCWKKKIPLSNGMVDPGMQGKALVKVRKSNRTTIINSVPKKKNQTAVIRAGSIGLGGSIVVNILLLIAFVFIFCSYQRRRRKNLPYETTTIEMNSRSFSYSELEQATGGFKEILGSGAYGTVYKGVLGLNNGRPIAVKKLNKLVEQGEQEFKAEVNAIGGTNHKNLVRLIGYCNEGQQRLLVYEFMSNGSLANFLFNDIKPSWYQRINLAFGVARGLLYLHEECTRRTIHCDIKPQNILLDDSLTAKISDFGLAKLLKKDQSLTTTGIRGTKGYVAPEWFKSKPITAKVDVYSFGIVLLELVCCRKNVEQDIENEEEMILCDWAYECYKQRKLSMLVENDKEAMDDFERVEKLLMIAISCTMEDPLQRPTMKKVTQMLEGDIDVCSIFPSDTTSSASSTMSSP